MSVLVLLMSFSISIQISWSQKQRDHKLLLFTLSGWSDTVLSSCFSDSFNKSLDSGLKLGFTISSCSHQSYIFFYVFRCGSHLWVSQGRYPIKIIQTILLKLLTSLGIPLNASDLSIVIYIFLLFNILKKLITFSFFIGSVILLNYACPNKSESTLLGAFSGFGPCIYQACSISCSASVFAVLKEFAQLLIIY